MESNEPAAGIGPASFGAMPHRKRPSTTKMMRGGLGRCRSLPSCVDSLLLPPELPKPQVAAKASSNLLRQPSSQEKSGQFTLFDLDLGPSPSPPPGIAHASRLEAFKAVNSGFDRSLSDLELYKTLKGSSLAGEPHDIILGLCLPHSELENLIAEQLRLLRMGSKLSGAGKDIEELATDLLGRGFLVQIRDGANGESAHVAARNCLRTLRHRFLVCTGYHAAGHAEPVMVSNPLIVEPRWKEQFLIANPTRQYDAIIQLLPISFVGTVERLVEAVGLLADQVAAAFRQQKRALPPWRSREAMLSKWSPAQILELAKLMQRAQAAHAVGLGSAGAGALPYGSGPMTAALLQGPQQALSDVSGAAGASRGGMTAGSGGANAAGGAGVGVVGPGPGTPGAAGAGSAAAVAAAALSSLVRTLSRQMSGLPSGGHSLPAVSSALQESTARAAALLPPGLPPHMHMPQHLRLRLSSPAADSAAGTSEAEAGAARVGAQASQANMRSQASQGSLVSPRAAQVFDAFAAAQLEYAAQVLGGGARLPQARGSARTSDDQLQRLGRGRGVVQEQEEGSGEEERVSPSKERSSRSKGGEGGAAALPGVGAAPEVPRPFISPFMVAVAQAQVQRPSDSGVGGPAPGLPQPQGGGAADMSQQAGSRPAHALQQQGQLAGAPLPSLSLQPASLQRQGQEQGQLLSLGGGGAVRAVNRMAMALEANGPAAADGQLPHHAPQQQQQQQQQPPSAATSVAVSFSGMGGSVAPLVPPPTQHLTSPLKFVRQSSSDLKQQVVRERSKVRSALAAALKTHVESAAESGPESGLNALGPVSYQAPISLHDGIGGFLSSRDGVTAPPTLHHTGIHGGPTLTPQQQPLPPPVAAPILQPQPQPLPQPVVLQPVPPARPNAGGGVPAGVAAVQAPQPPAPVVASVTTVTRTNEPNDRFVWPRILTVKWGAAAPKQK